MSRDTCQRCPGTSHDLVPTKANLRTGYNSFAELTEACEAFGDKVNGRVHRETNRVPIEALVVEQTRLHPIPVAPFTAALGETRTVDTDQTVRFGSVRYSTPPGLVGGEVWVRADGEELVITAHQNSDGHAGLVEVARHRLSTPGNPRIDLSHYPDHPQEPDGSPKPPQPNGPQHRGESVPRPGARCALMAGRGRRGRCPAGPVEDDRRLELAALVGTGPVDAALGVAAAAGRFAEGDLLAIVHHRANGASVASLVVADEDHSVQPGTSAWAAFGTHTDVEGDEH